MPTLACRSRALGILTSFSLTYRCEQGFLTVFGTKTKRRNWIELSSNARIAVSQTKSEIENLAQENRPKSCIINDNHCIKIYDYSLSFVPF